eukprot:1214255-Amphidinium_carterae.1
MAGFVGTGKRRANQAASPGAQVVVADVYPKAGGASLTFQKLHVCNTVSLPKQQDRCWVLGLLPRGATRQRGVEHTKG